MGQNMKNILISVDYELWAKFEAKYHRNKLYRLRELIGLDVKDKA